MASDPPIEAPTEDPAAVDPALAAPEPAAEAVEAAAPSESVAPAAAPPPPAEPVSKVKEWAVALAIMIVFAIICTQFVMFLRSNQYGGIGP